MRLCGIVLGLLLLWSGWSQADELPPGALGTRGGTPLRTVAPSNGGYAWLQMTVALLLIAAGLRYGLPRLIGWASKAGIGSRLDGEIRLLESRAVPGGSLLIVKARERLLLIGATPQGMQLLADLTENHSPPTHELLGRSEFEQALNRTHPPTGSPRRWGEPHGGGSQKVSRNPLAQRERAGVSFSHQDLQGEISAALQTQIAQARARLARVAQQEEL
jgi:flagellar biogenesis protein FliO